MLATVSLTAGCATTYDETIASEESVAAEPTTTTTLPTGTAAELLPRLVAHGESGTGSRRHGHALVQRGEILGHHPAPGDAGNADPRRINLRPGG